MDRGAWWATVHGVANSWTLLKQFSMHACANMKVLKKKSVDQYGLPEQPLS